MTAAPSPDPGEPVDAGGGSDSLAPYGGVSEQDLRVVAEQLGRPPRGVRRIAHRCPCGLPDVVETAPWLPDGSPFPTTYYLTCPRAASAIGTLEASGLMRDMTARLGRDPELAARYRAAHEDYLRRRDAIAELRTRVTVGGMPDRVKCLHALVAHSLVAGPGVNPFGDEALGALPDWWQHGPCVPGDPPQGEGTQQKDAQREAAVGRQA